MFYHFMNGPILIRQIANHFKWTKVALLGHSLGAIFSYTYGSLFPAKVDFIVCLDAVNPLVLDRRVERSIASIEDFLKYDELNSSDQEPPSYSVDEMEKLLHQATRKSIDLSHCKYILERNIQPSKKNPGKFYFARDARLKVGALLSWTKEDVLHAAKTINFPLCVTMSDKSPFKRHSALAMECVEIIKNNGHAEFYVIEGTHHVHLNNPQAISDLISPFILKHHKEEERVISNKL